MRLVRNVSKFLYSIITEIGKIHYSIRSFHIISETLVKATF